MDIVVQKSVRHFTDSQVFTIHQRMTCDEALEVIEWLQNYKDDYSYEEGSSVNKYLEQQIFALEKIIKGEK